MRLDKRSVRARIRPSLEKLEERVAPASAVIPLNNFGNEGMTLHGFQNFAQAGRAVAAAGDVNGDGFADIIVGANATNVSRGEAYVVFGAPNLGGTATTLNNLGTAGFTLRGFEASASAAYSVSAAGDVN